ncbi:MAG: hypothetical protein WCI89_03550 [bacterium]
MQLLFPAPAEPSVEECKARVAGAQALQAAEKQSSLSEFARAFLETRDRILKIGEANR